MTGVDFQILLPEILLAVYALAALMFGVYGGKDKLAGLLTWATAGLFVALALLIALRDGVGATAFGGMFVDDAFARFAKVVVLVSAAGVLVMAQDYMARRDLARFEYPILATLSVIGMMVMVSAGDLLRIYFSVAHDPTQLNRQGPDVGDQYRSAIFYYNKEQEAAAKASKERLEKSG